MDTIESLKECVSEKIPEYGTGFSAQHYELILDAVYASTDLFTIKRSKLSNLESKKAVGLCYMDTGSIELDKNFLIESAISGNRKDITLVCNHELIHSEKGSYTRNGNEGIVESLARKRTGVSGGWAYNKEVQDVKPLVHAFGDEEKLHKEYIHNSPQGLFLSYLEKVNANTNSTRKKAKQVFLNACPEFKIKMAA